MRPLDPVRAWLSKPGVFVPIGALAMAFLVYIDGRSLRASVLWGGSEWREATLAGVAFAMMGLLMAWRSMRRQGTGAGNRGRFPGLGVGYMAVVLIMFLLTHSRHHRPVVHADSPLGVAMLSCQIVLIVGIVIVLAVGSYVNARRPARATSDGSRPDVSPVLHRRPHSKAQRGGLRFWRKRQ